MTHTLAVHEQQRLFVVKTNGIGCPEGIAAFLDEMVSNPLWQTGMSVLVDHRDLICGKISPPEVNSISRHFRSIAGKLGDGKLALVMSKDIDFGIARAWEAITSDYVDMEIFVFREIDQALQWLGFDRSVL